MDKRRYLSRTPNVPKSHHGPETGRSGNPAADGYSVRNSNADPFKANPHGEDDYVSSSLMDETEARIRQLFGE